MGLPWTRVVLLSIYAPEGTHWLIIGKWGKPDQTAGFSTTAGIHFKGFGIFPRGRDVMKQTVASTASTLYCRGFVFFLEHVCFLCLDFICPRWCGSSYRPAQTVIWFCCCPTSSPRLPVKGTPSVSPVKSCPAIPRSAVTRSGGGEHGLGPPLSGLLCLLNLRASVRMGKPSNHGLRCTRFFVPFLVFVR